MAEIKVPLGLQQAQLRLLSVTAGAGVGLDLNSGSIDAWNVQNRVVVRRLNAIGTMVRDASFDPRELAALARLPPADPEALAAQLSADRATQEAYDRGYQAGLEAARHRGDRLTAGGPKPDFGGKTYDPERDRASLGRQLGVVWDVLQDSRWWTLAELAKAASDRSGKPVPEASASARIRDLRKGHFGGREIEAEIIPGTRLWRYRLVETGRTA